MTNRGRPKKTVTIASSGMGGFGLFEMKCKYCNDTALVSEGTKSRICGLCVMKLDGYLPIQQIQTKNKKEVH